MKENKIYTKEKIFVTFRAFRGKDYEYSAHETHEKTRKKQTKENKIYTKEKIFVTFRAFRGL